MRVVATVNSCNRKLAASFFRFSRIRSVAVAKEIVRRNETNAEGVKGKKGGEVNGLTKM